MVTAFQKFHEAIRENATKKTYQIYIKQFLDYAHENYDNLVKLPQSEVEDLVLNYIIHLKDLTERTGRPSPNSYNTMTAPIRLFLEMNDILLNWTKIKKFCTSGSDNLSICFVSYNRIDTVNLFKFIIRAK